MNNGMNAQTGQPIPDTFFKSFWDSVDDQDLKPEVKDFYQKFLQRNEKLKAEVVSYDILQDENKKKYAVYNIKVTIDHLTYTIQKRFTEFDEFRNNLRDKNPDLDLTQANFPTKTYFPFGGTSIETIDKRKVGFNDFLQLLVQKCKSQNLLDFLQFLDLKGRTEKAFNNQAPVEKQYINNTQEVTKLVEFLDLLNRNPHDTSKILQEMQNFYTDKRPKVTADIIRALLVGKPKSQGLVHFCGKIDPNANSHIVCTVGLKFLQSLMDHQKCQDADNFIAIYGNLDPKLIAMLNLSEHIEGKKQCKGAALQLADVFLNRNPKLTPNQILTKSEALQAFEAWKRTKITTFTTAERLADRLEDTEEAKDQEEYGLSPQGSSMGSLTEIAEKGFPSAQLTWSTLYKDDYIRIRYNGGRYLAVTIKANTTFEDCLRELAKGIDYRALCEESTVVNKLEDDTEVCLIKVRMDMPPWKHFALVSERRVQEESSEQVVLLERPAKKYSVMFSNTDLQIKRFTNIIIKQYHKTKGKNVKVKILVKNSEEGSKALQDHLVKEEEGKFLIESCKSFLEAVEKKN